MNSPLFVPTVPRQCKPEVRSRRSLAAPAVSSRAWRRVLTDPAAWRALLEVLAELHRAVPEFVWRLGEYHYPDGPEFDVVLFASGRLDRQQGVALLDRLIRELDEGDRLPDWLVITWDRDARRS